MNAPIDVLISARVTLNIVSYFFIDVYFFANLRSRTAYDSIFLDADVFEIANKIDPKASDEVHSEVENGERQRWRCIGHLSL